MMMGIQEFIASFIDACEAEGSGIAKPSVKEKVAARFPLDLRQFHIAYAFGEGRPNFSLTSPHQAILLSEKSHLHAAVVFCALLAHLPDGMQRDALMLLSANLRDKVLALASRRNMVFGAITDCTHDLHQLRACLAQTVCEPSWSDTWALCGDVMLARLRASDLEEELTDRLVLAGFRENRGVQALLRNAILTLDLDLIDRALAMGAVLENHPGYYNYFRSPPKHEEEKVVACLAHLASHGLSLFPMILDELIEYSSMTVRRDGLSAAQQQAVINLVSQKIPRLHRGGTHLARLCAAWVRSDPAGSLKKLPDDSTRIHAIKLAGLDPATALSLLDSKSARRKLSAGL